MGAAPWASAIRQRLADLERRGLRRRKRLAAGPCRPRRSIDGGELLCFASNDYLGLAADPRLAAAATECLSRQGVGAGAAHLLGGHGPEHQALEDELAEWLGYPRVLLFSTGYMANLGVVSALAGRHDRVIADRLNHASLIDAARLSGARHRRYAHGSIAGARERLAEQGGRALLVTDGVFSMDGDSAPLAELATACEEHQALLGVDDAHGIGVHGPGGRGSVAAAGLGPTEVPLLVGTLGKALGTFGAFVAASEPLIETLLNQARTYLFTTAPPPALAAATRIAVSLARTESWRRDVLVERVGQFREGAQRLGLPLLESVTRTPTPGLIQPVLLGEAERAVAVSEALESRGLWVPAVRPPTVPDKSSRLRITFSASHSRDDVQRLLDALAEVLEP